MPARQGGVRFAIVQIHIAPAIAMGRDMIQGAWELYAKWSCHIAEYSTVIWQCKT
jgi:hypothetical protein